MTGKRGTGPARWDWSPPADAQVFLARLTRLDPGAVVRLRPAGPDRTGLWARLPWGTLVTREVDLPVPGDITVRAAELRDGGEPVRRDQAWRWPLPPPGGTVLEEIPAHQLRSAAAAAAGTLREVTEAGLGGRAVGVRVLREALLDHVAIVVEPEPEPEGGRPEESTAGARVEIPQRLIQAVVRMGFLGSGQANPAAGAGGADVTAGAEGAEAGSGEASVRVYRSGGWVGLAARYGTGWLPPRDGLLAVRPR